MASFRRRTKVYIENHVIEDFYNNKEILSLKIYLFCRLQSFLTDKNFIFDIEHLISELKLEDIEKNKLEQSLNYLITNHLLIKEQDNYCMKENNEMSPFYLEASFIHISLDELTNDELFFYVYIYYLFNNYNNSLFLSRKSIMKKLKYEENDYNKVMNGLIDKQYIHLTTTQHDGYKHNNFVFLQ